MCFNSTPDNPGATRNDEIEKQLKLDKKKAAKEVKLLLLGAGESGKSTVLKQMRLIHSGGFTTDERRQWRTVIHNNLVQACQVVLRAMDDHGIQLGDPSNRQYAQFLQHDAEIGSDEQSLRQYHTALLRLWTDQGFQTAVERGNQYALQDNLTYFFDNLDRLFDSHYLPTDADILRARLRTTGISETIFDLGSLTYRMFDVGGQRSERKKWIHVFDNVQVVLFLVAISGYDLVLLEDQNSNQMREALTLFESIASSRWFIKSALILFLNKIDVFRKKIQAGASVRAHFPEYDGPEGDEKAAAEFFAAKYRSVGHRMGHDNQTYIHFTNATDTDLLKKTMASVQDMIVQKNLHALML